MQVGAYQLVGQLGAGGMGVVWQAEHALIGRRAAVKLLRPSLSADEEVVRRFFNEARAATAISDPGIVQIFDFGFHDGTAYLVMELLEGETLDSRLARLGTLPVVDALRIMRQVASSLAAAHAAGIVHRDLKPENVFLVRDPEVIGGERAKILDFGIAKLGGDRMASAYRTHTAAMMGTPMYMSPEQCRGAGQVDHRTDFYSLGCVLYTLVVGQPPFQAEGFGELIAKHLTAQVPRAAASRPGMSPVTDEVIARCLHKDPAARFADGRELAAALEYAIAAELERPSPLATAVPQGIDARRRKTTTLSAAAAQNGSVFDAAPASRRRWLTPTAVVVVAMGGVVTWLAARPHDARVPAPSPVVSPIAQPPTPVAQPAPAPPSPLNQLEHQVSATLTGFLRWAATHPTAACPNHGELASVVDGGLVDPWGHPLVVTCRDQPTDQIVGVISAGPDGVLGTGDDVASWKLGHDVTELVRGPHWHPAVAHATATRPHTPSPAAVPSPPPKPVPSPSPKPAGPKFSGTELGPDGIPTSR
jgi:serine/threonine-protein kinase